MDNFIIKNKIRMLLLVLLFNIILEVLDNVIEKEKKILRVDISFEWK